MKTKGQIELQELMKSEFSKLEGVVAVGDFSPGAVGDRVTLYMSEIPRYFDPSNQIDVNASVWIAHLGTADPSFEYEVTVEVHRYPEDHDKTYLEHLSDERLNERYDRLLDHPDSRSFLATEREMRKRRLIP